jgi:hypothetical protein
MLLASILYAYPNYGHADLILPCVLQILPFRWSGTTDPVDIVKVLCYFITTFQDQIVAAGEDVLASVWGSLQSACQQLKENGSPPPDVIALLAQLRMPE